VDGQTQLDFITVAGPAQRHIDCSRRRILSNTALQKKIKNPLCAKTDEAIFMKFGRLIEDRDRHKMAKEFRRCLT